MRLHIRAPFRNLAAPVTPPARSSAFLRLLFAVKRAVRLSCHQACVPRPAPGASDKLPGPACIRPSRRNAHTPSHHGRASLRRPDGRSRIDPCRGRHEHLAAWGQYAKQKHGRVATTHALGINKDDGALDGRGGPRERSGHMEPCTGQRVVRGADDHQASADGRRAGWAGSTVRVRRLLQWCAPARSC